ncbi:FGGY-family carbohydrate kinase [Citreicella sp. C3M06]|uniref:FGGY family carbohydrate kinase n=1 Tax=Citreicella sp. C3M06 TaxID=2841564 RepID=UPI001C0A0439|nr:FGGY-family carbohydrate kinase [Citreicella sp. C3M06]MBU2961035.1 FGGY-family carbohydrate kinase [Citreicella sp. C3M06]
MERAILAIDEGTTNSKAVLVSQTGEILASGASPVPTQYPQPGWVQQDANAIWAATQSAIKACIAARPDVQVSAIGISNQRESVLIWDRATGAPLGPVVTWQCHRTSDACEALKAAGHEPEVIARTGLPIDPMFPPTKAAWLLKHHASAPDICIGTVDSWLIWNLSGGAVHATDRSNAARTQLFDLAQGAWDEDLCALFGVAKSMLPNVHDSAHVFGTTKGAGVLPDGIPIASAIGDSHAALFGHGAFHPGDGKITFGTGSSVMTTVPDFIVPPKGITTTIAWSLNGQSTYAFEGNILVSASILPWTQALLGLPSVDALMDLAQTVDDSMGVTLVPAHVGLGAPHWNAEARGLISGLTFGAGPAHVARAAFESIPFQVRDVFAIMAQAAGGIGRVSVDGGPSRNRFLMGLVADMLNHPVTPARNTEASALGAAHLAGLATGMWPDLKALSQLASRDADIAPQMAPTQRAQRQSAWHKAIARSILDV